MEALRIREDGNGSHLDVAQVAVSLGSFDGRNGHL